MNLLLAFLVGLAFVIGLLVGSLRTVDRKKELADYIKLRDELESKINELREQQ